jgi:tetratricopeptide (TPR) repeat protein
MSSRTKAVGLVLVAALAAGVLFWPRGLSDDPSKPAISGADDFNRTLERARQLSMNIVKRYKEGHGVTPEDRDQLLKADALFETLIEFEPTVDRLHFGAAQISEALGAYETAIRRYRQALALTPQDTEDVDQQVIAADAHAGIAECLIGLKRYSDAVTEAKAALQIIPNHPGYLTTLAAAEIQLGQVAQARAHLLRATKQDPAYSRARQLLRLLDLEGSVAHR